MTWPPAPQCLVEHVTTSLDVGGAQAMLAKLATTRASDGAQVRHGFVSLLPPGPVAAGLGDWPIYSLDLRRRFPGPMAVTRLLRITHRMRPDLLQGWMYHGNLAATLATMIDGGRAPLLWNVRHSIADWAAESAATRALLRVSARLSRLPRAIIYNSRASARQHEAIGFAAERSVHIPNGFDCTRYAPGSRDDARARLEAAFGIPAGRLIVAMPARHHPMKDHRTLIGAMARVIDEGHDAHLLLVGPGIDTAATELAGQAARAHLPIGRLSLIGERDDVATWLPGVDLVALSSAWGEAFPNVLGEAMACGVPCVATDVGDCAEILGAGGVIVPPRHADALAAAIARLAGNADERRRRGDAGRARVIGEYELRAVARRYHELYLALARPETEGRESGAAPAVLKAFAR